MSLGDDAALAVLAFAAGALVDLEAAAAVGFDAVAFTDDTLEAAALVETALGASTFLAAAVLEAVVVALAAVVFGVAAVLDA